MKLKRFCKKEVVSGARAFGEDFDSNLPEVKPLKSKRLKGKNPKTRSEKFLIVVWAAVVGIGLAAGGGALLSSTANAMRRYTSSSFRWDWEYESVRYFEKYNVNKKTITGKFSKEPFDNGITNLVKYYQLFDQEYGLGYIDFNSSGLKDSHICSAEIFFPEITGSSNRDKKSYSLDFAGGGKLYSLPWQTGTKKRECHLSFKSDTGNGERNETNFVDHLGAAQYMGQRFDVREYFTSAYGGFCGNPHVKLNNSAAGGRPFASLWRTCPAATILEFHFYPYKTLEWVDSNLKFTTVTYKKNYRQYRQHYSCPKEAVRREIKDETGKVIETKVEVIDGTCWVNASEPETEEYNLYVANNARTTVSVDCPYGLDSCPAIEDELNIVDSISSLSELKNNFGDMQYIRKEVFDNMLKAEEDSIRGIGFTETGKFKGVMRLDDIDDGSLEGYTPLSGANRVFLTYNSSLKRDTPHVTVGTDEEGKSKRVNQTSREWYKKYCPAPADHYCQFEWDGTVKSEANKDFSALWLEFSSTSSEPLILAYYTTAHASGISSQAVPVIYVVDDLKDYSRNDPEAAMFYEVYDNTRKYYEEINGHSIETDEILKKRGIDPEEVLLYFNVTTYSNYKPYSINEAYLGFSPSELPWYRTNNIDTSDPIGVDESDLIKEATVYWSRISKKSNDFRNSCYSNNKEIVVKKE